MSSLQLPHRLIGQHHPRVKFRKYFQMQQCQKIRFKALTWESMGKILFSFSSDLEKLLILQHIWFYIIISISKEM